MLLDKKAIENIAYQEVIDETSNKIAQIENEIINLQKEKIKKKIEVDANYNLMRKDDRELYYDLCKKNDERIIQLNRQLTDLEIYKKQVEEDNNSV